MSSAWRGGFVAAAAVLLVFAYVAFEVQTRWSTREGARLFATAIVVPALTLAVVQLAREVDTWRRGHPSIVPEAAALTARAAAWFGAFFAAVWFIGLLLTVPLFALAYLVLEARESWPRAGAYAAGVVLFTWAIFVSLLHVPLPRGVLAVPLGIP
jgi:hypothetical protein